MSSSRREAPRNYDHPFRDLDTSCSLKFDTLSADLEYPPCPTCDMNPGLFTQFAENSDRLHCVKCGERFGKPEDVVTTRDLPSPLRDDYMACVAGRASIGDQAKFRDVDQEEIISNIKKAEELLSSQLLDGWEPENE